MSSIEVLSGDPFDWDVRGSRSAVAIGVFDGVHLGHQQVLRRLTSHARNIGGVAVALTFDPHPLEFVDPDRAPKLLTSIPERAAVMASCGVEILGVLPFPQIRDLEPHLFVTEILSYRLNAAWLAVGDNFRFGRDRSGDPALLDSMGRDLGFDVDMVSMVGGDDDDVISSTRIRHALGEGDVSEAERLLGRPFTLNGPVVHGEARGRSIGFPTANLRVPERMAVPGYGVYAAYATVGGANHRAVVNIGVRPTFGVNARTVEAYLLDFSADIYGEDVTLAFVAKIRNEQKFDSLDALRSQISADAARAAIILDDEEMSHA